MSDQVEPNDAEKKSPVYTYEWTVYHKRRYIAHFFEQEAPDYVNTTKKRLAAIQQALGISRTNVMHEVLQAGLEKLEDEIRKGRGKIPEPGEKGHKTWVIAQEYKRIWEKRQQVLDLEPIYNERGLEGFIAWCKENDIEYEDFLKYFTWRSPVLPHSERAENWLRERAVRVERRISSLGKFEHPRKIHTLLVPN